MERQSLSIVTFTASGFRLMLLLQLRIGEEMEADMLAVKATYDNGKLRWPEKPPVEGLHDLIVVFEDVTEPCIQQGIEKDKADGQQKKIAVLTPLPELDGLVPDGWKEAVYGG